MKFQRYLPAFTKLSLLVSGLFLGCKDPFIPEIKFKDTNFLVVEGYINVGSKAVTEIRLSRTVPLTKANDGPLRESGASLLIEDDNNNFYALSESKAGIYRSDSLDLPLDRQYRLSITTSDESNYVSDFTEPLVSPPIDSITWHPVPVGAPIEAVEIYAHTHNLQTKAPYYQWVYEEVYERRMEYPASYQFLNGVLVPVDASEVKKRRVCYEHKFPTDLIIASTTQFENNSISMKLLSFPLNDVRLHKVYAVNVTQNLLSREAYDFLRIMMKNTNSMGTFFDPQPSQLRGNIRKIDSDEQVIGFVMTSRPSTMRLMITDFDVPWWNFQYTCNYLTFRISPDELIPYFNSGYVPVLIHNQIAASSVPCADCRWWGGNNERPDYWPEEVGGED